ncbi:YjbF family lipoprotein [Bowmanella sp. JS7-9]|uniref:YjbF family lipoprotein n=1 Tax=Pseudobowmanella zhangzhouensis TaxID=1537679 RepID=A0ABW1XNU8_9ALTE|nr:YjbF family lipoprotein [Bowmanella sp. JS7-9]TBX20680.1 hypothetical protein TK45_14570 [Bowmanella sp. JS7-9]
MRFVYSSLFTVCILVVSGCSNTYRIFKDSFQLALKEYEPVQLTWEQIGASSEDLVLVEDANKQILLSTIFEDNDKLVVATEDRQRMIVFDRWRIIKTYGTRPELLYLLPLTPDPLPTFNDAQEYIAHLHWKDDSRTEISSNLQAPYQATIEINKENFCVKVVKEVITERAFIEDRNSNSTYSNIYRFDCQRHVLLQAEINFRGTENALKFTFLSKLFRELSNEQ